MREDIRYWLFVIRYLLFVIGYSLLVIRYWLFVIPQIHPGFPGSINFFD